MTKKAKSFAIIGIIALVLLLMEIFLKNGIGH